MEVKFLTDSSLGRLSKWLRLLGFDTVYHRGPADRDFLRKAEREGRVVVTRRRDLTRRSHPGRILVLEKDRAQDQILEVMKGLDLKPGADSMFRRCSLCNENLEPVGPAELSGLVPEYVLGRYRDFRRCRRCGKVYWPGTHRARALSMLQRILDSGEFMGEGREPVTK